MPVEEIAPAAGAASAESRGLAGSLRRLMMDSGAPRSSPPRDGQSAAARPGGVDPLAQLARLIEQDEAFAAIVRGGRSEQRVELSGRREDPRSSRLAREDKPFEHVCEGDAGSVSVPSFLCDGPSGEPHDAHEHGESDAPDYSNGLPSQRRGLRVFAALIGLALAGCASAMAYWAWSDGRTRGDEARVMGAAISPEKTTPSPRANGRSDERVQAQSDVTATAATITGDEKPADAKPVAAPQALPRRVVYGPAPTKIAGLASGPTPPAIPARTAQNQPPDADQPAPSETAASAPAPNAAPDGYVVQLSSQRSEAAAQATSRMLQTKYAGAFGDREPFIRRSDLGDRGVYYRVLTGPFSIGEAKQLCGTLKKSGTDCVVQRN